jgi:lysophospholipase L1-like esterase
MNDGDWRRSFTVDSGSYPLKSGPRAHCSKGEYVKSVICYGDSNTWGADPSNPERFAHDVRWTGVLASQLGPEFRVIEEGLNGRTTVIDELGAPDRNGLTYLWPCIDSHHPFDLMIIMLGTNDVKLRHNREAADIAESVSLLADIVRSSAFGPGGANPEVLIVCPPPIGKLTDLDGIFAGAAEKTRAMPRYYEWAARRTGSSYLNAGEFIRSSDADGVHFDAEDHRKLGIVVAAKVRSMLSGS